MKLKPLVSSVITGSGFAASLSLVNEWLQFVTLLCSAILGVVGVLQWLSKKKK